MEKPNPKDSIMSLSETLFKVVPPLEVGGEGYKSRGKRFIRVLGKVAVKAKESFSKGLGCVNSWYALAPGNIKESQADKGQENGRKMRRRLMAVGAAVVAIGAAYWAHKSGLVGIPGTSSSHNVDPGLIGGHAPSHTDVMAQPTGGSAQSSMPGTEHVSPSSSSSASVDSAAPTPSVSPDTDTTYSDSGSGGGTSVSEVQPPAPAPEVFKVSEGQGQIKATQAFLEAKGYRVTSEQAETIAERIGPIASGPGVEIDPSSGLQIFNGGPGDYSMSAGSSDAMIEFAKELLAQQ